MGQKQSIGGHHGDVIGDGEEGGRAGDNENSPASETCLKSFSDNNLAWYSRPWKQIDVQPSTATSGHGKPPTVEALTSSTSTPTTQQQNRRTRPASAGNRQPRDRPSSGLFSKAPPFFSRLTSKSKPTAGSVLVLPSSDVVEASPAAPRRPPRPLTVFVTPTTSGADNDDVTNHTVTGKRNPPTKVLLPATGSEVVSGGGVKSRTMIDEILKQTVDFLVHEIEPVLIAEYLKRQRRTRRHHKANGARKNGSVAMPTSITSSPVCMTERELRSLLADIILAGNQADDQANDDNETATSGWSEDFWTFCRLLRKLDADRKSGEFLEALGALLRIVSPCDCRECGHLPTENGCHAARQLQAGSDNEIRRLRQTLTLNPDIKEESEDEYEDDDDVDDGGGGGSGVSRRHFDVEIVYVDSETREPRPFNDVAELKRCRRRKSRIGLVVSESDAKQHEQRHQAVVVRDTADRYIPMLVVRVSGLVNPLCETRTRRLEHLLEDFPDRILRLTLSDVDLDPSSTLRLSRAIERNPGLHSLRVVRTRLGTDGATLLSSSLSHNTGLRSLCLAGNDLSSRGVAIVVRALLKNCGHGARHLAELDLGDNPRIGDAGCRIVAASVQSTGCPLRRLSLRRCGIGPLAAGELFAALRRNSRVVSLDVGGNRLVAEETSSSSAVRELAESLIVNRTLRELIADDSCGIRAVPECSQLARALRTNTMLRRLRLDGNPSIGDRGAELLADGLRYNRGGIEELGLAGCSIGNAGLAALIDATTRYNMTTRLIDVCRHQRRRRDQSRVITSLPRNAFSEDSRSPDGLVQLSSPDSDCSVSPPGVGTVTDAAVWNGNHVDEVFSSQRVTSAETARTGFDHQLVSVVDGLSRPRILVD